METVESVAKWADETFGPATTMVMVNRACQEMQEMQRGSVLRDPVKLVEEAADIVICLYRLIYHLDPQAIEKKMAVNRARQWDVKDGVGQHK